MTKFLASSPLHACLGLRCLDALVDEMHTPASSLSLTAHRKAAVSFRDQSLLEVRDDG